MRKLIVALLLSLLLSCQALPARGEALDLSPTAAPAPTPATLPPVSEAPLPMCGVLWWSRFIAAP